MIRAVCFDLWNTLILEGPGGLVKPRVLLWERGLQDLGHAVTTEALTAAHGVMFVEFQAAWHANRQFASEDAAQHVCDALGLGHDAGVVTLVADSFDPAGRSADVHVVARAEECLVRLRDAGLRTAVICDVGLVPSSALRWHLEVTGLARYIDHCVFSDEVGSYKPDARGFHVALRALGDLPASDVVHVGDRVRTDVVGAAGAGLRAVRFSGVFDDPDAVVGPHHEVIADLMEIPSLLDV